MPGVIPLEDAQQLVTDRLQQHAQDALQSIQDANQPPLQNTQLPVEVPAPQIDPNEIIQRLQQHAQGVFDAAQQANQPPLQNVQIDPNEIVSRLQQHAQDTFQVLGQTLQASQQPDTSAQDAAQTPQTTGPGANAQTQVGPSVAPGGDLRDYARQAARKAGIDPDIFLKQIDQESGFNPVAKSGAGAIGIAQFMPATAQGMGIDPTDPYAALDAAAQLDAQNLKKYGGDYAKALAAYNAGPGNVDQYGGVPPFEETQRYVRNILGGAASAVGTAVDTARGTVANAVLPTLSQFGDRELNSAEAYAACGPAAAVRFSQMFGRNPTLREAVDLAKNVGWTADTGMAGLQSESKLFDEMNIPHRVIGADWQAFAKEAQSGNPVTLSTPGHYFTADAYDPKTGAFHVGSSGTDLRGGKEWMTPAEMEQRMGPLQGGLAADNPNIPGTSPLSQGTRPAPAPTNIVEQGAQAVAGGLKQVDQAITGVVQGAVNAPGTLARGTQDVANQLATEAPQHLQNIQNQLRGTPAEAIGGMLRGPELLTDDEVLRTPQADTARQMLEQFRQASAAKGISALPVTDQDVAGAARTMLEGQSVAMSGKGIGREPLPAEPGAPAPPAAPPPDEATYAGPAADLYRQFRGLTADDAMAGVMRIGNQKIVKVEEVPAPRGQIALASTQGDTTLIRADLSPQQFATTLAHELEHIGGADETTALAAGGQQLNAAGKLAPLAEPASTRMYHGTGAAFDRPSQFSDESLFGPGYYVTSDPRVAGGVVRGADVVPQPGDVESVWGNLLNPSTNPDLQRGAVVSPGYAQARNGAPLTSADVSRVHSVLADSAEIPAAVRDYIAGQPGIRSNLLGQTPDQAARALRVTFDQLKIPPEQQEAIISRALPMNAGPNVRAVDVPQNLKLLDVEATIPPDEVRAIAATTPPNSKLNAMIAIWEKSGKINDLPGQYVYSALNDVGGGRVAPGNVEANRILQAAGYDGITYQGGSRIPMTDATGAPIEHQATVVFPESLDKIRNAISGRQGGAVDPLLAARLGGTVAGGVAGYQSTPDDAMTTPTPFGDFPTERVARTIAGASVGAAATGAIEYRGPLQQQILENLRTSGLHAGPARPAQAYRGVIPEIVDQTKQLLLTSPTTHIGNVIGNTIELGRQPVALAMGGRTADAFAGVTAVAKAIPEAAGNALSAIRGQQLPNLSEAGANIPLRQPIYRALSAADAFTRTLGEYQGMASEANRILRDANMSPRDPGVAQYLAQHSADLFQAGSRDGAQSVFGRPTSTATSQHGLENIFRVYNNFKEGLLNSPDNKSKLAGALLDFEIPFSGVPVRMVQLVAQRTPGLSQARGAVRAAQAIARGDGAGAQRIAGEVALESSIQFLIAKNIVDGNIRGPDDPDHPNGIHMPGLGWVNTSQFGSYALPMQVMASFVEGYEKGGHDVPPSTPGATDLEKYANYYSPRFNVAFNASMKPLVQAIPGANMIRALSVALQGDLTAAGTSFARDTVNRLIVPGAARFAENMTDPVARDVATKGVKSIYEPAFASLPGVAQLMPAKIDPTTGDVLNKARSGIGTLVGQQQDVASPLTIEADRLHKAGFTDVVAPKAYPQDVTIGGAKVTLSPDEQRAVTQITGAALDRIAQRMDAPEYQNAPDPRKALMLKAMINSVDAGRVAAVTKVLGTAELRSRVIGGQRTAGQLNQQAAAPDEFSFFNPTSGDLVNTQRALAGSR